MSAKQLAKIATNEYFQKLIAGLPQKFSLAFSYGSAAVSQSNRTKPPGMVDYLVAVDDPLSWHQENLKLNPHHYSFLRWGGPSLVRWVQEDFGASIYYNSLVEIPEENRTIKYGVVSTASLLHDLKNWSSLYAAGRLHKPVVWIQPPSEQDLQRALNFNLTSAVRVAMLLLPEIFTDEELFLKIANLSYTGDFRMKIAEDQNKVKNIVRPQLDAFWKLYEPHIFAMKIHWNSLTRIMEQDISPAARIQHLSELPKMIRHQLLLLYSKDGHYLDVEDVLITVAHDSDCGELINTAINRIVSDSSWRQSLKGIFTAGLLKSVKYSTSKVRRRVESLNPTNPS